MRPHHPVRRAHLEVSGTTLATCPADPRPTEGGQGTRLERSEEEGIFTLGRLGSTGETQTQTKNTRRTPVPSLPGRPRERLVPSRRRRSSTDMVQTRRRREGDGPGRVAAFVIVPSQIAKEKVRFIPSLARTSSTSSGPPPVDPEPGPGAEGHRRDRTVDSRRLRLGADGSGPGKVSKGTSRPSFSSVLDRSTDGAGPPGPRSGRRRRHSRPLSLLTTGRVEDKGNYSPSNLVRWTGRRQTKEVRKRKNWSSEQLLRSLRTFVRGTFFPFTAPIPPGSWRRRPRLRCRTTPRRSRKNR